MLGALCAVYCTTALLVSCSNSDKLVVYKVKSVTNGKVIDVIEGESVTMAVSVGDSVIVNLNDSEITDHLTELRLMTKSGFNVDSASLFVVQSSYISNK